MAMKEEGLVVTGLGRQAGLGKVFMINFGSLDQGCDNLGALWRWILEFLL